MECIINQKGELSVFRRGTPIKQMCPFNTNPCSHKCPHFTEMRDDQLWLACNGIADDGIAVLHIIDDDRMSY